MTEPANPFGESPLAATPSATSNRPSSPGEIPQGFPADPQRDMPLPPIGGLFSPEYSADPLVTPPGAGFHGWRARFWLTMRNTWHVVLGFVVIGAVLQSVLRQLISASAAGPGAALSDGVIVGLIGQVGYAFAYSGATYVIVMRASGRTAGFGAGARFGLRRMFPVWGLLLVNGLVAALGAVLVFVLAQCAGVVGALFGLMLAAVWALYVTLAGGMIPAAVAIRYDASGIRSSWSLFNRNLGAASGRLLLSWLPSLVPVALPVVVAVVMARSATDVDGPTVVTIASVISTLVTIPAWMVLIVGTLITYAELRTKRGPLLSRDLAYSMEMHARPAAPMLRDWSDWKPGI